MEYGEEILQGTVPVQEPIVVDLKLERSGRNVRVTGDIRAKLLLSCSRCLEDFEWEITDKFDFLLVLPRTEKGYPDIELSPEDMDVSFFDGEAVDVAQIAAEQIFLQIPIKPLCHEGCKGFCPGCGANLNYNSCSCLPRATASSFEVLKDIKPKNELKNKLKNKEQSLWDYQKEDIQDPEGESGGPSRA